MIQVTADVVPARFMGAYAAWKAKRTIWPALLWLTPGSLCRLIQVENPGNPAMSDNMGSFPNLKLHT
jgi:hypothetical protein